MFIGVNEVSSYELFEIYGPGLFSGWRSTKHPKHAERFDMRGEAMELANEISNQSHKMCQLKLIPVKLTIKVSK